MSELGVEATICSAQIEFEEFAEEIGKFRVVGFFRGNSCTLADVASTTQKVRLVANCSFKHLHSKISLKMEDCWMMTL